MGSVITDQSLVLINSQSPVITDPAMKGKRCVFMKAGSGGLQGSDSNNCVQTQGGDPVYSVCRKDVACSKYDHTVVKKTTGLMAFLSLRFS